MSNGLSASIGHTQGLTPAAADQLIVNLAKRLHPTVREALHEILPVLVDDLNDCLVNCGPYFGHVAFCLSFHESRLQHTKRTTERVHRGKTKGVADPKIAASGDQEKPGRSFRDRRSA